MIEVQKIKEKVELKDMEINADPCKYIWEDYGRRGGKDCLIDCVDCGPEGGYCAYGSDKY